MAEQEFHLEVTNQSVYVRLDVSTRSGKTRFYVLAFFACVTVLGMCALLFSPGKHGGQSLWHGLLASSGNSAEFLIPLFLLLSFPFLIIIGTRRYVMLAYPSDETFRADRLSLSVSRVHWLDVHNSHWDTFSFSIAEVRDIRFQAISRLKGGSVFGLRFLAGGKTRKVLPGLTPRDAVKILTALRTFGADVADDPLLQCKLEDGHSA